MENNNTMKCPYCDSEMTVSKGGWHCNECGFASQEETIGKADKNEKLQDPREERVDYTYTPLRYTNVTDFTTATITTATVNSSTVVTIDDLTNLNTTTNSYVRNSDGTWIWSPFSFQ